MRTLKPIKDVVIVKLIKEAANTFKNIIIPETVHQEPMIGTVVAINNSNTSTTLGDVGVETGDMVAFGKWSGTRMTVDGIDHAVLHKEDIFGKII